MATEKTALTADQLRKWDELLKIADGHRVHDIGVHPEGYGLARFYIHCWCNDTLDDFDDYAMHIARLVFAVTA